MSEPRVTVLHVDDNEANRYIVTRILQNACFNVVEAATGQEGLDAVAEHKPDLVILDVKLPDLSGFEVCRQIKSNPKTAMIPVLHLSANFVRGRDKAEGLDCGADVYLAQPVEPIELIATVRSLLRIRRAEEAARSSAQEWQTTFDAIKDSVCLLDREGKILRCNRSMSQLFGKRSDKFLGCVHYEAMAAELGIGDGSCFRRASETLQRQVLELHGKGKWFAKTIDPILDENGSFTGAVCILSDITDRKQVEESLQAQSRELSQMNVQLRQSTALVNRRNLELDQFAHIVSHDLKAPLRAISNLSQWIQEDLADQIPQDANQNLELLRLRVSRMNALIDGLLTYARIGYQDSPCESFEINELLLEIVDSLDIPSGFTIELPSNPLSITTNRLLLSQVFANLISNAVKHHNRPDGKVRITAQAQAQGYKFSVADDGKGIEPKDHSRIFNIFQTLQSPNNDGSTGLGLAIVKKVIERAGGQIHLESELGQGTTFHFTWPILSELNSNPEYLEQSELPDSELSDQASNTNSRK
jgi:PAS domain S-box-containing protein